MTRRWFAEAVVRWADNQDRLSPADESDKRIPDGGTPGYAVADIRAGAQLGASTWATLTVENITDASYRVHGSGVDGAGTGVIVTVSGTLGGR